MGFHYQEDPDTGEMRRFYEPEEDRDGLGIWWREDEDPAIVSARIDATVKLWWAGLEERV